LKNQSVGAAGQVENPDRALSVDTPQLPRLAYSLKETATILGISYITAFRLVQRGLLRSSSALRTKLISHSEIERFLRATTE
jgi:hypothetical protein